ncbi:MAG: tyrosine-type recombinase/integrase [Chelatococcus sp.]|nr:tyrosine-type recombinase/integrase [Chelatococcus sp.]
MEWLVDHFGASTLITDIDADKIARMIARRRAVKIHRDKDTRRLVETPADGVKNATVNRYATEPLRKLFVRARDVWGYTIKSTKWGDLLLPEPAERVREASPDEESAIMSALGEDYGRLFRFMMATGLRSQAALLAWTQVDLVNQIARVRNKAKNGQERWYAIPLVGAAIDILLECEGHHEAFVFTYAARRDIGRAGEDSYRKAGNRYPITDSGFRTEWRRCVKDSGIAPGFRRHDTRHTVGTRFLRATGNLKATQKLLGHSRVETTTRYAHVLIDDLRDGLLAIDKADARNAHKNTHTAKKKAE